MNLRRVLTHPILGPLKPKKLVHITVDGQTIEAFEDEPIAAALLAAGIRVFRQTPQRKEPRGLWCAIGQCTDCAMIVNGKPNVRTCITPVRKGMHVRTQIGLRDD